MDLFLAYLSAGLSILLAVAFIAYGCTLFASRLSRVPTTEAVEQRAASVLRQTRAELRR